LDARTAHEAVEAFRADLSLALSCVTPAVPQVGWYRRQAEVLTATLAGDETVPLRGAAGLRFGTTIQSRVLQDAGSRHWAMRTAAYGHVIADARDRELLSYHWHPEWRGQTAFTHLHLGSELLAGTYRRSFGNRHLPTGRVALEDVLCALIEDLGVQPLRADWRERLGETRQRFEDRQSWAGRRAPSPST
jgi:hypothetical protein